MFDHFTPQSGLIRNSKFIWENSVRQIGCNIKNIDKSNINTELSTPVVALFRDNETIMPREHNMIRNPNW